MTICSGPFDTQFNAITGLNGTGKSNILDSICFVLGITNLDLCRVKSLNELVYKMGQAGVTKASVTITFNNEDKTKSPVGHEHRQKIIVERQVVVGGRNKYVLNGQNVQAKAISDMFHSVGLNVNNPHFLIMQGRITKVINMKPTEILALTEEAAGTKMYQTKRDAAQKKLDKADDKIKQLTQVLDQDILPMMAKLKKDRDNYLMWQSNTSEIDRLQKFCAAHEFVSLTSAGEDNIASIETKNEEVNMTKENIKELEQKIKDFADQIEELKKLGEKTEEQKRNDEELKELNKAKGKEDAKLKTATNKFEKARKEMDGSNENLEQYRSTAEECEQVKKDHETTVEHLENQMSEFKAKLDAIAQKYKDMDAGIIRGDDDGDDDMQGNGQENAGMTLQEQLMAVSNELRNMDNTLKQKKLIKEGLEKDLPEKRRELAAVEGQSKKLIKDLEKSQAHYDQKNEEIKPLRQEMEKWDEVRRNRRDLQESSEQLAWETKSYGGKIFGTYGYINSSKWYACEHLGRSLKTGWDVKGGDELVGPVCDLFKIKPEYNHFKKALEEVAGHSNLCSTIVHSKKTVEDLLKPMPGGQRILVRNQRFLPLDNMNTKYSLIDSDTRMRAQQELTRWQANRVLMIYNLGFY